MKAIQDRTITFQKPVKEHGSDSKYSKTIAAL